jgi:hypothetical protein
MAKRIDYSKDSSRRRGIRENIEDVKGKTRASAINPSTDSGMRTVGAPLKAETKANQDRLARIEKMQEAEEAARKQKIAAAKEERAARMKAEVEAAKAKAAAKGGGSPSMLSPRRAMGISPTKKRLMLAGGGKACRGRKANYKV